jgi:3-oxoacyl-[acyl-carrier-protein] synthase III
MRNASMSLPTVKISDIAVALPRQRVANDELINELPKNQRILLARHVGVKQRHVADAGETAVDLGEAACRELFSANPQLPEMVDTLIFCTQTADYILPPNSCLLHGRLGLASSVAAFDLPHACSAFVYAIHIARALVAAGSAQHVLIVTADTYSKLIDPLDRSTRLLFGDGAAATWVENSTTRGVQDVMCGTLGKHFEMFLVPAGGARRPISEAVQDEAPDGSSGSTRSAVRINMQGHEIFTFVKNRIPPHINDLLARNQVGLDQIDWFVFHQASSVVLDALTAALDIAPPKVLRHLETVGNTVSASIPITLRAALDDGRIRPGDLVLLSGFGSGLSWGSALVRW